MLVHDFIRTLEGLRQNDVLVDMNGLLRNVGFFLELAKGAVQIRFTPYAASLRKPPLGLQIIR